MEDGGWVEFHELSPRLVKEDGSIVQGYHVFQLYDHLKQGFVELGREFDVGDDLEGLLCQAGFSNVQHHCFPVPLGSWPEGKDKVWSSCGGKHIAHIHL